MPNAICSRCAIGPSSAARASGAAGQRCVLGLRDGAGPAARVAGAGVSGEVAERRQLRTAHAARDARADCAATAIASHTFVRSPMRIAGSTRASRSMRSSCRCSMAWRTKRSRRLSTLGIGCGSTCPTASCCRAWVSRAAAAREQLERFVSQGRVSRSSVAGGFAHESEIARHHASAPRRNTPRATVHSRGTSEQFCEHAADRLRTRRQSAMPSRPRSIRRGLVRASRAIDDRGSRRRHEGTGSSRSIRRIVASCSAPRRQRASTKRIAPWPRLNKRGARGTPADRRARRVSRLRGRHYAGAPI